MILAHSSSAHYTRDVFNDGYYIFTWEIDEAELIMKVELNVRTTGWVGFGLSSSNDISQSDTVMCKYNSLEDQAICVDGWSIVGDAIPSDESVGTANNLLDVSGSITDKRTYISFTRKLNTGDSKDLKIEKGKEINVMFIFNENESTKLDQANFLQEARYTSEKIVLYDASSSTHSSNEIHGVNDWSLDIVFDNYGLSSDETSYICKSFDLNTIISQQTSKEKNVTYHAIRFEPFIDNDEYVHHMVLFGCNNDQIEIKSEYFSCMTIMPEGCGILY